MKTIINEKNISNKKWHRLQKWTNKGGQREYQGTLFRQLNKRNVFRRLNNFKNFDTEVI